MSSYGLEKTYTHNGGSDKNSFDDIEMANKNPYDEDQFNLAHAETFQTTYEQGIEGKLFHEGELIIQPAPTRDPKDPMNLPLGRKVLGVGCLSFFGALAASAEIILGACLPVFAIEYSPVPPPAVFLPLITDAQGGFPVGFNPLKTLEKLGGPPLFDVYLLAALPLLMIGLSNFILVPLAITLGRRPVNLVAGVIAIAGAVWAGESESLGSHIGARCVQAIGAGTVESLIPFVIQDIIPVHQRNLWISSAFATQGVIIIAVGFSAPYIVINQTLTWRWVYHITAIAAAFFLCGVFLFLPETRWNRTKAEMNGVPRDDAHIQYSPRTWRLDLSLLVGNVEWKKGWHAFVATLATFFYPQIFFVTVLNGCMISASFAASYVAAPALLTKPWSWKFEHVGFCLVAVLIASLLVAAITGGVADWAANQVARRNGKRIAENQLINLILPTLFGLIGSVLFGLSGEDQVKYPWPVFLLALGLLAFGFLGTSSIGTVYVLECYPHLAGPALVSIASFRFIIAFALTVEASNWVVNMGYLTTFSIYAALIGGFMLLLPVVYFFGPSWRRRWPATRWGH